MTQYIVHATVFLLGLYHSLACLTRPVLWSTNNIRIDGVCAQGIYNRPGIKSKNGRLEIASQIIDCFYLVDKIFAQFFLLDEINIYSAHVGTKLAIVSIV